MKVSFVSITRSDILHPEGRYLTPEELIVYIARASNPSNQLNMETAPKLLRYLIDNKHWSPFEMVDMTVEIKTSRAIAQQILRHRSFSFQEFSQRYAKVTDFEEVELRKQAEKNRQSSLEEFDPIIKHEMFPIDNVTAPFQREYTASQIVDHTISICEKAYQALVNSGVSKETARFILPLTTQTTIYMKGSVRSWLTYFNLRLGKHTQKEHRLVAEGIRDIFISQFPEISKAFNGFVDAYETHFI